MPGSVVAARVDDDALSSRGALGSSRTSWAAYRHLEVRGSAVVLRLRGSATFVVLPRTLFTDADLAAVRAHVGPA